MLRRPQVKEGATTVTATTLEVRKTTKLPQHRKKTLPLKTEDDKAAIKREIKSECDEKPPVGFMNTRATNVAGLSQTNLHLIRCNSANHLASFLNSKRTNTEIDARKRTEEAPNDDGARDQAEPETNLSNKMPWAQSCQARPMEENANEAEFSHAWSRELSAYSMRRSGRPQRAKHPNQPQPANPKAATTDANEIKKELMLRRSHNGTSPKTS